MIALCNSCDLYFIVIVVVIVVIVVTVVIVVIVRFTGRIMADRALHDQ